MKISHTKAIVIGSPQVLYEDWDAGPVSTEDSDVYYLDSRTIFQKATLNDLQVCLTVDPHNEVDQSYVVLKEGRILFISEFEHVVLSGTTHKEFKRTTVCQTSVSYNLKLKNFVRVPGLASYIFNTFLLTKSQNVVSDKQQTHLGMQFWLKNIARLQSVASTWVVKTDMSVGLPKIKVVDSRKVDTPLDAKRQAEVFGIDSGFKSVRLLLTHR